MGIAAVVVLHLTFLLPVEASGAAIDSTHPRMQGTNVFSSVGSGVTSVHLDVDTKVTGASFSNGFEADYLSFVLSGPNASTDLFMRLTGPGIDFPPVYGNVWDLPAGTYHAYVIGPKNRPVTVSLDLDGIPGTATFVMDPWEGSTERMSGLADVAGSPLPFATSIDLQRGKAFLSGEGAIWIVEDIHWAGLGGALVVSAQHKVQQGLLTNDCILSLSTGTAIGPYNPRTVFAHVFPVSSGEWQTGVDLLAPSTYIPTSHASIYIAHNLLPEDPLRNKPNLFWRFLLGLPPLSEMPPEAQAAVHDAACTMIPIPETP